MSVLTKMTAIADAIRAKTGRTDTLTLDEMASSLNAIANKTSSDLTVSGATVTAPAGNYKTAASKSVATATQATPSITVSTGGLITASATQTAGYVSAGTKSATKQMDVLSADAQGSTTNSNHHTSGTVYYGALSSDSTTQNYVYTFVPQYTYTGNVNLLRAKASDVATAVGVDASKILAGTTILDVAGTMPVNSNQYIDASDIVIGTNVSYTIPRAAYTYNGTVYVRTTKAALAEAIGLTSGVIVDGTTILGVLGSATPSCAAYFTYHTYGGFAADDGYKKLPYRAYTTRGTVVSTRYVTLPAGTYKVIGNCWYAAGSSSSGNQLYIAAKDALGTSLLAASNIKENVAVGSEYVNWGRFYANLELTASTTITVVFHQAAGDSYSTMGEVCVTRIV